MAKTCASDILLFLNLGLVRVDDISAAEGLAYAIIAE